MPQTPRRPGDQLPNPGSSEAIALGCICPVIDNYYGEGMPASDGPLFWTSEGCEVHHPTQGAAHE